VSDKDDSERAEGAEHPTRSAEENRPHGSEQIGYRKGDEHSGGGGSSGGGGKQREPAEGWEKGDRRRIVDDHHTHREVPAKPGRKDEGPERI
jgi:hypothetical protein